eukprot:COSAG02_NODE_175_length_31226_cov_95.275934_18_plen_112_part_00
MYPSSCMQDVWRNPASPRADNPVRCTGVLATSTVDLVGSYYDSSRSTVNRSTIVLLVTELWVLRTFGGVDFSLIFICAQSVPEFLWDRLRASIQFPVMPKRAQYARFSGEY